MRSKNLVPVQVILPSTPMGSGHSSRKLAFEEALQSSIEASLRSSGTVPSRVFSALYHRSRPHSEDSRPGPSVEYGSLLPPPDSDDVDVKPDVSGLNRELLGRVHKTPSNPEEPGINSGSPGTPSTPSVRTPSVHSTVSPREQQNESIRGPPPLLLSMPQPFVRPSAAVTNSDALLHSSNGNRILLQRMPTLLPKNLQLEQLKQAQAEQLKQLQQIHRWHLLQQRQQHQARAVASSMTIPRLPFFNPPLPSSAMSRNALVKPGSSINGIHGHSEQSVTVDPTSPGSPMFRKGFCKGGKDIRLSTLKRDGSYLAPFPSDYTLIAMSISPSSPQITTSTGAYQSPDIPSEAMVVVAISLKCLPPEQQEMSKPLFAQCVGCGDGALSTFVALSSHINLRTTSPSQSAANVVGTNPLQRHARNYVIKDSKIPHGCIRGAAIPWQAAGNGNRIQASLPRLMSMYMSANQQAIVRANAPHPLNPREGLLVPRTNAVPASQAHKLQLKFKPGECSGSRVGLSESQTKALSPSMTSSGISSFHRGISNKTQPTTSNTAAILINSPSSANVSPKQHKPAGEYSPISAGPPSNSPTSDALTQSRVDPDWNSTVKFPDHLPPNVGRPLILICWEWQQLQSNIQNVHITHSYTKCYEEAMTDCHDATIAPLSREMCYMVTSQYLSSIGNGEFPTTAGLSAWLGRSRLMLASMRQVQISTAHAVTLARMTIINHPHKIGLIVSQISQAHAINECIANLRQNGPCFHIIAHISGDTILDLCILVTGQVSRLARENLLTEDEYLDLIEQNITSEDFKRIQINPSDSHIDHCITELSSGLHWPDRDIRTSFLPTTQQTPSTSSSGHIPVHVSLHHVPELTSPTSKLTMASDENNNSCIAADPDETTATWIGEQLFSHVSTLCEDRKKIDLARFTSVRFSFLLPPSPVCQVEAVKDITDSGVMQDLGLCATRPAQVDLRKVVFTTSAKTKQRFNALCEHMKVNSSTLFVLFHLDAHLHCDSNSVGSEWMSSLSCDLLSSCQNVLIVSCTHIPQALLNQNTSVSSENILFSSRFKLESANSSKINHCSSSSCQEVFRDMTFDPYYETESLSVLDSAPQFHSTAVNAKILTHAYIAALALVTSSHQVLSTGRSSVIDGEKLRRLTTPTTVSIVKDLLSSRSGITVLLRVQSEPAASKITSEITEARNKLNMLKAFEIMQYGSHIKPRLSEYFLEVVKKYKQKPEHWTPDTLADVDCIPLLLVYTGREICNHLMPSSLRYVDLRLSGNNSEALCQSFILSEIALAYGCYKVTLKQASLPAVPCTPQTSDAEPPLKKRKGESKEDPFSDESDNGSGEGTKLKWRTFDEKQAAETLRKLSNGKSSSTDEFSSEDEIVATGDITSRKRALDPVKTREEQASASASVTPRVVLSKNMLAYVESYFLGTEKFTDLQPHSVSEWTSHARPIINEKLTGKQTADYLRKWVRPLPGHPDFKSPGVDLPQSKIDSPRHILLVTPPRVRVSFACCLFMKRINSMLVKLLQVEVIDHKSSITIKPCYPLPNSDLLPQWPVHSTILDMDFDPSISNSSSVNASRITNGTQDSPNPTAENCVDALPTAPCMAGKLCAQDFSHRCCSNCKPTLEPQRTRIFQLSLPGCGIGPHTVCDGTLSLDLSFTIPDSQQHHFVFRRQGEAAPSLQALDLCAMGKAGLKTPVFSLGLSGAKHGLYNLDHTLLPSEANLKDAESLEINEADLKPNPLHIIVVRKLEAEEFKVCWPNHTLMILPEIFDDLGIGAMKYVVQCLMHHSIVMKQEQHNAFQEESSNGDVWPFALLLDDVAVLWTACDRDDMVSNSPEKVTERNNRMNWKNISLYNVLKRIESVPCAERYAAIGFRPWASEMEATECEEDFSGDVVSSAFSKCLLTSCVAVNAILARNEKYDFARFLNEDVDWCMRVASADLPLFRFNDIALATKVVSSSVRKEFTTVNNSQALVSLADSEFVHIPRHPSLLLELHFERSGNEVFPKAKENSRHPVLVVDHYVSLGPDVYVEFASSKPDASPWATNSEKSYCGLLLYCQSSELSQNFLQQFKFTTGATVCVVGRDRSSLRQAVVKLHLENDWHFRLTDEFQTTNETSFRKPLYYLTGVSRTPR